jgi:hypothetical protein
MGFRPRHLDGFNRLSDRLDRLGNEQTILLLDSMGIRNGHCRHDHVLVGSAMKVELERVTARVQRGRLDELTSGELARGTDSPRRLAFISANPPQEREP